MASDSSSDDAPGPAPRVPRAPRPAWQRFIYKFFGWAFGLAFAGLFAALTVAGVALSVAYPNLPDIGELSDYRPKLPMRIFTSDGVLMGEFGEERRNLTPINEIPAVMKNAVLAIEDARFYSHSGVDYKGMVRAAVANLGRVKSQGASTITMQVARNVYLSTEKTFTRKLYEVLLTFKLEHQLAKDQILEIYMNQIFLGNRAYGFAAACETYFGKPLKDITIAEAAMLAGLPKAPSAFNPVTNPARAPASCTSSNGWRRTVSSRRSRPKRPRSRNCTCAPACRPPRSGPSTSPRPCASWCSRNTAMPRTRAA